MLKWMGRSRRRAMPQFATMLMWGQPPSAVRSSEARLFIRATSTCQSAQSDFQTDHECDSVARREYRPARQLQFPPRASAAKDPNSRCKSVQGGLSSPAGTRLRLQYESARCRSQTSIRRAWQVPEVSLFRSSRARPHKKRALDLLRLRAWQVEHDRSQGKLVCSCRDSRRGEQKINAEGPERRKASTNRDPSIPLLNTAPRDNNSIALKPAGIKLPWEPILAFRPHRTDTSRSKCAPGGIRTRI
jgi:hypothetical protein